MANRETITAIVSAVLNASRLTQVRAMTTAHENCWKEALNGSNSSQLAAQKKQDEIVAAAIADLDDKQIEYILQSIK